MNKIFLRAKENWETNGYKPILKLLIMHTKVDAFIINQVHLTAHYGTCNADMDKFYFLGVYGIKVMWWWL